MAQVTAQTMTCGDCQILCQRFGKHRNGLLRFCCRQCKRTFTEAHQLTLGSMYIPQDKAMLAVQLLLEGNSIRSTERITNLDRNTIMKLLLIAGEKCERVSERLIRNVPVTDLQADELWGFCRKKESRKRPEEAHDDTIGDTWTFVCIERNSKLIVAWHQGRRTSKDTLAFTEKIRNATAGHFQITTDGFTPYRDAVEYSLGMRCDFAQLVKVYANDGPEGQRRYSPAEIVEAVPVVRLGKPDPALICTSHVERQNLTMRMQIRRLTRLTNGFSKKVENHTAAIALHFAYYNFCRIHSTIRVTPAMEARITDRVWTIGELLA